MPQSPKIHFRSIRGHLEVIWWLKTHTLHAPNPKWDLVRKLCFLFFFISLYFILYPYYCYFFFLICLSSFFCFLLQLCFQVFMGHLRSFRGHLKVIWWLENQIWWAQSTQHPKKPRKRHITCPKWDLIRKLCFQVLMGHLRSFGGHLEVIWWLENQIWWAQSNQRPK